VRRQAHRSHRQEQPVEQRQARRSHRPGQPVRRPGLRSRSNRSSGNPSRSGKSDGNAGQNRGDSEQTRVHRVHHARPGQKPETRNCRSRKVSSQQPSQELRPSAFCETWLNPHFLGRYKFAVFSALPFVRVRLFFFPHSAKRRRGRLVTAIPQKSGREPSVGAVDRPRHKARPRGGSESFRERKTR
jgi:hypothetical protein